jgi:AcrR family transcriptional regulator
MATAAEKRRIILDAAVRVFARQGFNGCRVSDIADEAGVAYGLVYHYFRSKDEVLDTLFLERWNVLLEAIRETDRQDISPREKLHQIASFIIDSYRHDPELMKVIIVEVTRAANSFGQTSSPRPKTRAPSRTRSRRSSRRWRSTGRSSRCSPAGSSSCSRRATRSTSRPRISWSKPSAPGSTALLRPSEVGCR